MSEQQIEEPAVFEFGDESEYDNLLNWANKLDGGPSAIPEDLKIGDIVVRRPGGDYQVYRRPGQVKEARLDIEEMAKFRLSILDIVSRMPRFAEDLNESVLDLSRKYEGWIFGDSDTGSKG